MASSLVKPVAEVRGEPAAPDAGLCLDGSIKVSEMDDFLPGGDWDGVCSSASGRSGVVPEDEVGDDPSDAFVVARPRTSSAISAADFFFVLSSSDDRLDDMMVSRVPTARLLLLAAPRLLRGRLPLPLRSESDVTIWRVGP